MARPIIRPGTGPVPGLDVRARPGATPSTRSPELLARRLREPRSRAYLEALRRLDTGTLHETGAIEPVIAAIHAEFGDLAYTEHPLAWVSRCYLGPPYEVHTLDMAGGIVEHYARGRPLPGPAERARALALHPAYEFIEVYPDSLHCVRADGSVTRV
jgi:hypothetical protein